VVIDFPHAISTSSQTRGDNVEPISRICRKVIPYKVPAVQSTRCAFSISVEPSNLRTLASETPTRKRRDKSSSLLVIERLARVHAIIPQTPFRGLRLTQLSVRSRRMSRDMQRTATRAIFTPHGITRTEAIDGYNGRRDESAKYR